MEILTLKIDRFATPRLGPFEELIADRELIAPDDVNIPDLWHVVEGLKESQPNAAAAIYQAWIIAHDLLLALRALENMPGDKARPGAITATEQDAIRTITGIRPDA